MAKPAAYDHFHGGIVDHLTDGGVELIASASDGITFATKSGVHSVVNLIFRQVALKFPHRYARVEPAVGSSLTVDVYQNAEPNYDDPGKRRSLCRPVHNAMEDTIGGAELLCALPTQGII